MKILILGGTRFVGRAMVEHGLSEGHELTLFNRGRSNAGLFPGVERLIGDRDGGLEALRGREWDAVIDTCGYVPRLVRDSSRLLKDSVGHYLFVSTISVFARFDTPGADEDFELATLEDETIEVIGRGTYGGLKVLCERSIDEEMGGRAVHLRAGFDRRAARRHGPVDVLGAFAWADGGEVLVPGGPEVSIQFIDARDLAAWAFRGDRGGADRAVHIDRAGEPADHVGVLGDVPGRHGIGCVVHLRR